MSASADSSSVNSMECAEYIRKKADNCMEETLARFLFQNAECYASREALNWYDPNKKQVVGITYQKLSEEVSALGSYLYQTGWKRKTVALAGDNSYAWVLFFLTALCSDMTVVPIDPELGTGELWKRVRHCGADALVTEKEIAAKLPPPEHGGPAGEPEVKLFSDVGAMIECGRRLLQKGDFGWAAEPIRNRQRCMMLYTSGTGGKMKAAVLRQENLTLERFVWENLSINRSRSLLVLPLFHIAGIKELYGALMTGSTVYLSAGLKSLLREFSFVRPMSIFCVPMQAGLLGRMLEGKTREECVRLLGGSLRLIRTSGAPLPEGTRERFASSGITVTSDYGMTETGGPVSVSVIRKGSFYSKPGSAGRVLDRLEVRVDHPDEQGTGEILVSGQGVFDGYYNDPAETKRVLKSGWLHTGDMGFVDEDRFLTITGRLKNVIILSSGENVIPEALEDRLSRIPGVEECLVFEKDGKIAARIRTGSKDEDADAQIREEIRQLNRMLPTYMRIGIVENTTEALPRTDTGKLRRDRGNAGQEEKKET